MRRIIWRGVAALVTLYLIGGILSRNVSAQTTPIPLINEPLIPASVSPGGPGFTLTVNGTGFIPTCVVNWNGSPRTTTFVSSKKVTAAILATDIAATGTARVTVVNPGAAASNVGYIQIISPQSDTILLSPAALPPLSNPSKLAIAADFNGDGVLDLATSMNPGISIFIGKGDGTFQLSSGTGNGTNTQAALVAGDFNGDGKLDLAFTNSDGTISIALGNGDGAFQTAITSAVIGSLCGAPLCQAAGSMMGMAAGDFNADGKLDLVVVDFLSDTAFVLLGNGDGTLQAPSAYVTGAGPVSVVVADFNGDGRLDFAVANSLDNTLAVFLGNGGGSFQNQVTYATGVNPVSIVTEDFNADGQLDLATANNGGLAAPNTVSVLLGNGGGTFQARVDYATCYFPSQIMSGDLNGDGNVDLVVVGAETNFNLGTDAAISILAGNGDGTFNTHSDLPLGFGSGGVTLAIGDFNGDGLPDFTVTGHIFLQSRFLGVSNSQLSFDTQFVETTSSSQSSTVTNNSGAAFVVGSITSSGPFTQTNNCGASLASGTSCTINVTFTPRATGGQVGAVNLGNVGVSFSGTGTLLDFSPSSLAFSAQRLGTTSSPQIVTVTNHTAAAVTGFNFVFNGAGPTDFHQTNTCGTILAAGASCSISVTFVPSVLGFEVGRFRVDASEIAPHHILLEGEGGRAVATISPSSLTFTPQPVGTTSAPQNVTLTNTGTMILSISGVSVSGSFAQTNNCPGSLIGGAGCTVIVTFGPTAPGAQSGTLTISNDASSGPQSVSLGGTGLGPAIGISSTALTFGAQILGSTSGAQTITLTNSGNVPVTMSSIAVTGINGSDFSQSNTCPASLLPAANCSVNVTFTPVATGPRSANLTITDSAPDSPQVVTLTGAGAAPVASISTSSISFPNQYVGSTGLPQTVTVTNTGSAPLAIASVATAPSDFGQLSACGNTLSSNSSCAIGIFFDPTVSGSRTGTLTINDNAPGSPQTVALSGTGQDFTLMPQSATATVAAGQAAMYSVAVSPGGGFNQTVTLACTGAPSLSTCNVSPPSVALTGSTPSSVTVTVATTAPTIVLPDALNLRPQYRHYLMLVLALIFLLLSLVISLFITQSARTRDSLRNISLLAFALCTGSSLAGCAGGGSASVPPKPGTQTGTYSLTLTGTFSSGSANLSRNARLTLIVQ